MWPAQNRTYFLNRYINGGSFTPSGGMLSVFFPKILFRRNAKLISKMYSKKFVVSHLEEIKIDFPVYSGANKDLIEIKSQLMKIRHHLTGAFVHGSYATGEEIPYSDFDGLIILNSKILSDEKKLAEVAFTLHGLRSIMHRIDPFQHHGWFVLSENDLTNYPEWFLPVAVLHHSRSLIGDISLTLRVQEKSDVDLKKSFLRLCESIQRKLSDKTRKWNLYQLKAIFSEFMMLPASYVQARDKKGIFKKYSFQEMEKDFPADDYAVMNEVSSIRSQWNVKLSSQDRSFLQRLDFLSWKRRQSISIVVPNYIQVLINNGLFTRMNNFTALAKLKIQSQ